MWRVVFSKQALKDAKKLSSAGLHSKSEALLAVLGANPYQIPPAYEKLIGDLAGKYLRRINVQHRLVYEIHEDENAVKVLRMWSHYE